MKINGKGYCGVLALGMLAVGIQAHGASVFDPDGDHMFGDWGGERSRLEDQGVTFKLNYISESAYNLHGGYDHNRTVRYTDQFAAGVTLDLDTLIGIPGAEFQITFTDRNGDDLTSDRLNRSRRRHYFLGSGSSRSRQRRSPDPVLVQTKPVRRSIQLQAGSYSGRRRFCHLRKPVPESLSRQR